MSFRPKDHRTKNDPQANGMAFQNGWRAHDRSSGALHLFLLILITTILATQVRGQNLIPNGGFEDTTDCADYTIETIGYARPWYTPNECSPDLYDDNPVDPCGIYTHDGGEYFGPPADGERYLGSFLYECPSYTREPFAVRLTAPLQAGVTYSISGWIRLAHWSLYAVNRVGIYFEPDTIVSPAISCDVIPVVPQAEFTNPAFWTDSVNWTQMSSQYTAFGGELHVAFGTFQDCSQIEVLWIDTNITGGSAYYYFDALSITAQSGEGIEELGLMPGCGGQCLMLSWPGVEQADRVQVFDALGRCVHSIGGTGVMHLPPAVLSNLAPGIYAVRCEKGRRSAMGRWMKAGR